ncbi:bifunctional DNA primase/polymerase [Micromonospora sp. WMMD1102]|uniref:bifunctional DNA primase/polymerase n=1 Tax=Micromonospora sp. WMMD1102 TaxID=3016105 RepID=UPI0024153D7B|nr:bifunctional DNA primase/polymerase [Micromonospora sp. WMMD1102]MDG4790383.1 bifunctional DNA primase/polymerase [Micromonospora sp. WMMD1102]MDG4792137.1 bifunctional DNA primase/polymerase [Micromonospora sp. WMMD1102]
MTATLPDVATLTAEDVRTAARAWHAAGCAVLPVKADGSKRPDLAGWTRYQAEQPSAQQMAAWFNDADRTGLGVVCGAISGGLEMFELEGRAVADGARERLVPAFDAAGVLDVWRRLSKGYAEWTPSGGLHLLYRLADREVPGNTKVARRPKREDEYTDEDRALLAKHPNKVIPTVLAETRGEGGFVVVAPSHGTTHDSGKPWQFSGSSTPGAVPTITWAERDALFAAVHAVLDQMPEPEPPTRPAARQAAQSGDRPGDVWAARTGWADILEPHGWKHVWRKGDMDYWRRPGDDKKVGWSARTGGRHDALWVWSTSTEFPTEESITKFRAYAILDHQGNDHQAASALRAAGHGGDRWPVNEPHRQGRARTESPQKRAATAGPAWPVLHEDARYGLAADLVNLYDPHTEADPAAVMLTFLATAGCRFGSGYYITGGNTRHAPKVWPILCGDTATGAKGTAVAVVRSFWRTHDKQFVEMNTATGLSTGEGLIRIVRDANGDDPSAPGFDEGVHDKRLWVDAPEFASVLERARREGNSLSGTLREAYDDLPLQTMTSGSPLRATGSHVVIVPQITPTELVGKLTATDVANGLANRFMTVCSRMSKTLPEGSAPDPDDVRDFSRRLDEVTGALFRAYHDRGELRRTAAARKLWASEYHKRMNQRRDEAESPVKSLLARWHANSARLSVIYALLDGTLDVDERHVRAALACWDYVEASTRYVFGSAAGDRDLGRLMEFIDESETGRTRKAISVELFQRHKTKKELDELLDKLLNLGGYACSRQVGPNGGAPAATYYRVRSGG